MDPAVARMPCFAEESTEDGSYGHANHFNPILSRSVCSVTGGFSFRNVRVSSSPRSLATRVYDARFEDHQPHFLDSCFLCKKPLGNNRDIFMYKGDTPFCSEECRQDQIDIDEAKEKWNLSSMKALRNKQQRNSNFPSKAQDYTYHASTVAAA